ncbi:MAG: hypothetical protein KDN22_23805 [Verrucomicrobiae bacterium]|nr:hypothetical protein [Verrucomicrobiae bacterium]
MITCSRPTRLRLASLASLIASTALVAQAEPQPEFSLPDVNPGSARSGQVISPRQYTQQITVWYFGREW